MPSSPAGPVKGNLRDVLMVIEQCCSALHTSAFAAMSEPRGKTRPERLGTATTPVGKRTVTELAAETGRRIVLR